MDAYPQYQELSKSTVKNAGEWRAGLNKGVWIYLNNPNSPEIKRIGGFRAMLGALLNSLISAEE